MYGTYTYSIQEHNFHRQYLHICYICMLNCELGFRYNLGINKSEFSNYSLHMHHEYYGETWHPGRRVGGTVLCILAILIFWIQIYFWKRSTKGPLRDPLVELKIVILHHKRKGVSRVSWQKKPTWIEWVSANCISLNERTVIVNFVGM